MSAGETGQPAAAHMAPPEGFKPPSSLPQPPVQASSSSLRNASGGQPPIQPAKNGESSTAGGAAPGSTGEQDGKEPATKPAGPVKPVNRPAASKNAIVYNAVQRRNPVMHAIKNVPTEIGDIAADYQVGTHNGVLFLSLKYHRLHPEYIHQRIEKMKNMYSLRIVMVLCDIAEHQLSLREISKIAVINELTVFVAWSNDEVAQYLATFKAYEHKSADTLKERVHQSYHEQLQHALTSGRKVNKTDADNLASQFGSFANIARQPAKALAGVKGLGATKVTSLVDAFTKPFVVGGLKRKDKGKDKDKMELERADIITPTARAALANVKSSKGKERASNDGRHQADGSGDDAEERAGSPDWPDEEDEDHEDGADDRDGGMRRARAPSRSPGLSPDRPPDDAAAGPGAESGSAWRDPLDDEAEDEEEGEASEGEEGSTAPVAKRPRMS